MIEYIGASLKVALLTISAAIISDNNSHLQLGNKVPSTFETPFDYIVIGGGTAGCVIAARLSEDPNLLVLLLEEGDVENVSNDIPAMDVVNILEPTNQLNKDLTTPQPGASMGFPNNQTNILTGRVLGGGTSINGMMYNRGGKGDYDGWVLDYGAEGWSYEEVLPYFKKSEDQTEPDLIFDTTYHSTGGPLTLTSPSRDATTDSYNLLSDTLVFGAGELGYHPTDINGQYQIGTTRIQRTTKNGKRLSTASAFLKPALNRTNLFIVTGARVTKLHFQNKRADSVQFDYKGRVHYARVNAINHGEIILAAGAINSPKLLLLSGIGPKQHLDDTGIPVLADLPVGHNLHDHIRTAGVDFVVNSTVFVPWQDLLTVENLDLLHINGTGPLSAQIYLHQAVAINIKTSVADGGLTFGPSDVMVAPSLSPPGFVDLAGGEPYLNQEILDKYYGPYFDQPTINLFSCLNYVKGRGSLRIRSANPYDPAIVDPGYLRHPDDLARLIEAYKFSLELGKTDAFQRIGAKIYEYALPGCEQYFNEQDPWEQSDAYIECKLRHLTASEFHVSGSCKMASANDPTAVVDPRLRVLGEIEGVRVADASIMPSVVTGNIMAPVIMIGEKAADMILQDRRHQLQEVTH